MAKTPQEKAEFAARMKAAREAKKAQRQQEQNQPTGSKFDSVEQTEGTPIETGKDIVYSGKSEKEIAELSEFKENKPTKDNKIRALKLSCFVEYKDGNEKNKSVQFELVVPEIPREWYQIAVMKLFPIYARENQLDLQRVKRRVVEDWEETTMKADWLGKNIFDLDKETIQYAALYYGFRTCKKASGTSKLEVQKSLYEHYSREILGEEVYLDDVPKSEIPDLILEAK